MEFQRKRGAEGTDPLARWPAGLGWPWENEKAMGDTEPGGVEEAGIGTPGVGRAEGTGLPPTWCQAPERVAGGGVWQRSEEEVENSQGVLKSTRNMREELA